MSDETVVETSDVTVSKFFNAEDFPVPAVAFDVESNRDEAVTLAIVDEIPDQFGIDQIGFHPEYGSEHWEASGDGVVQFEREIDAGESFTTVYGVRMDDDQDASPFLSAPTVEVAGDDIDEVVPPESTDVVRELAGGERDTVPGLEDEPEAESADDQIEAEVEMEAGADGSSIDALEEDDAEILGDEGELEDESEFGDDADFDDDEFDPELDSEDPAADVGGVDTGAAPADDGVSRDAADMDAEVADDPDSVATDGASDDTAAGAAFDAGNVAAALATAIRQDEVDDEDMETLREEFAGVPQSTEVELDHLQSRVSELESYADALEAFIDENGTAQNVLGDLESDVETLQDDVASVEADVNAAASDREDLHERVDDIDSQFDAVDDLEESLDRLRGDIDALDERLAEAEDDVMEIDELESDVDDLEDDLEDVEEDVEEIDEWRSQLSDVFGT